MEYFKILNIYDRQLLYFLDDFFNEIKMKVWEKLKINIRTLLVMQDFFETNNNKKLTVRLTFSQNQNNLTYLDSWAPTSC